MTEAQVAILARRGVLPERDLTWFQASLLIDRVTGSPIGRKASAWLRESGASAQEAAQVIERAQRELPTMPGGRLGHALDVRLEVLNDAARGGRRLSGGEAGEREELQQAQAAAGRARQRDRRRAWARESARDAGVATSRASPRVPRRRMGR